MSTLRWEGEIANAAEYNTSGTLNGRLYCTVGRSNNTVTISNVIVHQKSNSTSYYDWEWQAGAWVQGVYVLNRQTKGRTGGANLSGIWYGHTGVGNTHAFGVGTGSGTFSLQGNWRGDHYGESSAARTVNVSFPAAGAPSGTTGAPETITTTSVSIRNNVTSWGSYCTAGSVRSYRADNASFTSQTYIATTDNALVTHTGLTPNDEYWFRGWQNNGAGLSAYQGSTRTAVTLPLAPVMSTPVPVATTCTIPTTIDVGGGKYTITKQYRTKETVGGTYGAWTTYSGANIEVTDLTPSTDYTIEVQSITTAGTTVGSTDTFETLPAGKLIYSNGDVVNAIPRAVVDGSPTVMVNVSIIEPA